MKKLTFAASGILLAAIVVSGCGGTGADGATAQQQYYQNNPNIFVPDTTVEHAGDAGHWMHTNHLIMKGGGGQVMPMAATYYTPAQIRTAYGLPSTGGSGTIVIVDAYDDKYALNDFNTFSTQYGLPKETSTNVTASTNKVLQVVYASGRKPTFNSGWSQEEDLDIEWAHAIAPNAKIVLVEAASASTSNLYAADNTAATIAGVHQVSNSWGGGEYSGETSADSTFNHTGVVYFFSSGDTGGAREYPAESPNVVSVGGTSLTLNGSGGRATETAWSGAGGGPSAYEARPSYQSGIASIVGTHRGVPDVSAVADPNTGVIVRWNGAYYVFGGTSVACPIVAAMANLAGANRSSSSAEDTFIYGGLGGPNYYDVTSGTAGSFTATGGWDFITGVGAPIGTGGY